MLLPVHLRILCPSHSIQRSTGEHSERQIGVPVLVAHCHRAMPLLGVIIDRGMRRHGVKIGPEGTGGDRENSDGFNFARSAWQYWPQDGVLAGRVRGSLLCFQG